MRVGRKRPVVGLAFAAVLAMLLALIVATGPAAGAQGGVYVALGDSYTSGPLVPNQHGSPIDCGRSDHNYPSLVAAEFKPAEFIDVSCGSAVTKDMTEPQTGLPLGGTNPPQFNALRADATLVTVGIGGNDAGLVSVGTKCAQLGLLDPFGTACRNFYAPGGNDSVKAKIEATRPKIDAVLQGIHQRSPDARVVIVGYPNVLPLNGGSCYPIVPLSADDVAYVDGLIRRINSMISEEAVRNDAEFVDTYTDSIGHDVCKLPPTRWFEGLVPTEPAYPLHPNAKGEASMARSAIAVINNPLPAEELPTVSNLRVNPKRLRGGEAAVQFRLSRSAGITLARARVSGKGGSRVRPVYPTPRATDAGSNRFLLQASDLGRRPGRYRLVATPIVNGVAGEPATARYRVGRSKPN